MARYEVPELVFKDLIRALQKPLQLAVPQSASDDGLDVLDYEAVEVEECAEEPCKALIRTW